MSLATTTKNLMGFGVSPQLANLLVNGLPAGVDFTMASIVGTTSDPLTVTGGVSSLGAGRSVVIAGGVSGGTNAGSSITLTPGGVDTGAAGGVFTRGVRIMKQVTPTAKTTSATLTAAEVLTGIITGNQGAAGAASYQLPTASALQTAMPAILTDDDAFDFVVINISTVAAEDITITTNTGWTLVGSMVVESRDSDRARSSGIFRARRTASNTFTLYRIA